MRLQTATSVAAILISALAITFVTSDRAVASGLGVKVGMAFAKQDYSYSNASFQFDNDYRRGLSAGLFIEQPIVPVLSVRAEGMFITKGFKVSVLQTDYNGTPIPRTADYEYGIDYLSLDFVGKASLPTGTYVMAGPRLDVKLNTEDNNVQLLPTDLEDRFRSTIFGWTLGVGQSFGTPTGVGFFVEGQLFLDQDELYDRSNGGITTGSLTTIKNKSFALFAGLRF